jgi:hypothetical protein
MLRKEVQHLYPKQNDSLAPPRPTMKHIDLIAVRGKRTDVLALDPSARSIKQLASRVL